MLHTLTLTHSPFLSFPPPFFLAPLCSLLGSRPVLGLALKTYLTIPLRVHFPPFEAIGCVLQSLVNFSGCALLVSSCLILCYVTSSSPYITHFHSTLLFQCHAHTAHSYSYTPFCYDWSFLFLADSSDSHDYVQILLDSFVWLTHPKPDSTLDPYLIWLIGLLIPIWSDSFTYWCSLSSLLILTQHIYWWSTKLTDSWLVPLYISRPLGTL